MSGVHVFDGGRALTIQFSNGYMRTTNIGGSELTQIVGSSPLEAAMRCFVAYMLGDEIEIPES